MGFGWVVFGKSSCYWLYSGDVDEMLMRCWCVSCCDNAHVWNVCSCSMFCLGGCFVLVTLLFQVITCYNQSGSVKKKQTPLIHSNQILRSMMLLRCFTWIVPIHPELGDPMIQHSGTSKAMSVENLPINNPVVVCWKDMFCQKRLQKSEDYLDHRSDFLLKMSISPDFGADWNT